MIREQHGLPSHKELPLEGVGVSVLRKVSAGRGRLAEFEMAAGHSPALSDISRAKLAQSTSSRPLATVAVSRSWTK